MRSRISVLAITAFTATVAVGTTLAIAGPASATTGTTPTYTDSVTYQVNAKHDGLAGGSALPANLKQKWSTDLDGTVSYPLIAGGRVFVTARNASGYGTDLYGFDANSGAKLWGPVSLGGPHGFSGLAYENGGVFAIDGYGVMSGFSALDGTLLWSEPLPGQSFSSPITTFEGVAYTAGSGSGGTLYAVDEKTGSIKWTAPVENGDDSGPAIDRSGIYVSYACELSYRFSFTGEQLWKHQTGCEGGGGRTPVLHYDRLWVRDSSGMPPIVLSRATGDSLGNFTSTTAPAFSGKWGLTLSNGTLTGISATSRAVKWTQRGNGQLASAPVISGNTAYVGSGTGTVFGYDIRTGKQVWSGSAGAPVLAPDEQNAVNLQGLAIGDGVLAVPASTRLTVFG